MKKGFGIKTGACKFDIPNDRRIIVVELKMATYMRISMEISRMSQRYVQKEYSVDESFLKLDG